jgi:hypothetical protein
MIMTGTDHHIAGLGNLVEWTNFSGQNFPKGKTCTITCPNTQLCRGLCDMECIDSSRFVVCTT